MEILDLNGMWEMQTADGISISARIPGSSYEAMLAKGIIEDPFWSTNEAQTSEIAEQDFSFYRTITIEEVLLCQPCVELVAWGLDTLCTVYINGIKLGETSNVYRTWRWNVKNMLKVGENKVLVHIANPLPYILQKQEERKLKTISSTPGINYLRKPPYHFGWDWGPKLTPAGIIGGIRLEAYRERLEDVHIHQHHSNERVVLELNVKPSAFHTIVTLTRPGGDKQQMELINGHGVIDVNDPKLWWPNGMGKQPLYTLQVKLEEEDVWERRIGLRKIRLDTSRDKWGERFRFEVNGEPLFARGANWIPSDSFVNRTEDSKLRRQIEAAREANMNMLRVWGGGFYEKDTFYDLCDEYGILVWQDFIFACGAYPFYDNTFILNIKEEVHDNVCRLRHHASLALWCGNNENELLSVLWRKDKELLESNIEFYHTTLPEWLEELDSDRSYWPGSPSSGLPNSKPHDMNRGDAHLWHMWHGMRSVKGLRNYPARFCSEYGIESLPGMDTIRSFTAENQPDLLGKEMKAHQKSGNGNEKMLYYLLEYYRMTKGIENLIYLTQLVQARIIGEATCLWRQNLERHGGALFWQYNDCWPAVSWSSIGYNGEYKALQYAARHFNKPIAIHADIGKTGADIWVVNELSSRFQGSVEWKIYTFKGEKLGGGSINISADNFQSIKAGNLLFKQMLKGRKKNEVVLALELRQEDNKVDSCTSLLVPDRKACLPSPDIHMDTQIKNSNLHITLNSNTFVRSMFLEVEGVEAPLSDNFCDLLPGDTKIITVPYEGMELPEIRTKSVGSIPSSNSVLYERLLRVKFLCNKASFKGWILFRFLL
jgi:beta-mannosidase